MILGEKRWSFKAQECLAIVMPVGSISEQAWKVDDASRKPFRRGIDVEILRRQPVTKSKQFNNSAMAF
jgi:hypothetical protein